MRLALFAALLLGSGMGLVNPPAGEPPFLPAFPGAEGFGAKATGGRGGQVYEVTNLDDAGPGSLRDAVSKGDRTVIFRVSGTIELKKKLTLTKPNITIAGQTAPGDGICLKNYTFGIATQNVIVRYFRCRLGDLSGQEEDSISILNGAKNVIVDHCSATWSVDECLSTSGNDTDITVQWCLIAEPLNNSIHSKGAHGYGSRWPGPMGGSVGTTICGPTAIPAAHAWATTTASPLTPLSMSATTSSTITAESVPA